MLASDFFISDWEQNVGVKSTDLNGGKPLLADFRYQNFETFLGEHVPYTLTKVLSYGFNFIKIPVMHTGTSIPTSIKYLALEQPDSLATCCFGTIRTMQDELITVNSNSIWTKIIKRKA